MSVPDYSLKPESFDLKDQLQMSSKLQIEVEVDKLVFKLELLKCELLYISTWLLRQVFYKQWDW